MGKLILKENKWSNTRGETEGIFPCARLYARKIPAYDSLYVSYAPNHLAYAPVSEGYAPKSIPYARVAILAPMRTATSAD